MEVVKLVKPLYLRVGCCARLERQWSLVYFSEPQKYNNETSVIKLSPVCDKFRMSLDLCDVSQHYYNLNRLLHVILSISDSSCIIPEMRYS